MMQPYTQNPVLRAVFAQIARDEDGHLGPFHIEYLVSLIIFDG